MQVTVPSARPSVPNEHIATFKRDGTAVLSESHSFDDKLTQADLPCFGRTNAQERVPLHVFDPNLLAMSPKSTPGTPRMQLIFILGAVQTMPVWNWADFGSVRNLIYISVYNRLPFKPPLRDPGDVRVI